MQKSNSVKFITTVTSLSRAINVEKILSPLISCLQPLKGWRLIPSVTMALWGRLCIEKLRFTVILSWGGRQDVLAPNFASNQRRVATWRTGNTMFMRFLVPLYFKIFNFNISIIASLALCSCMVTEFKYFSIVIFHFDILMRNFLNYASNLHHLN